MTGGGKMHFCLPEPHGHPQRTVRGELRAERQQVPSLCQQSSSAHSTSLRVQNHHGQQQQPHGGSLSATMTQLWALSTTGAAPSAPAVILAVHVPWEAVCSVCSLLQCSSTCGKGLQSRVVQCMHKVTGRHGSECPALAKPPAYRQCHQEVCNDKINVNTITSPRLGESGAWGEGARCPGCPMRAAVIAQGQKWGEAEPESRLKLWWG